MKPVRYPVLRTVTLFVAVGPSVGTFVTSLGVFWKFGDIGYMLVVFVFFLPFAYIFGFIPAILAGWLFGAVWKNESRTLLSRPVICAVTGSVTGALGGLFLILMPDGWFYCVAGAISGAVCAMIVRRYRIGVDSESEGPGPIH